jgi:hypothetical protein
MEMTATMLAGCSDHGCETSVPTDVGLAPAFNASGRQCEYFPLDLDKHCKFWVEGICPVGVPDGDYRCHDIHPHKYTCDVCGEEEPDFSPPDEMNRAGMYVPTDEEIHNHITHVQDLYARGEQQRARQLGNYAVLKVALKYGFSNAPGVRFLVLLNVPSDPLKEGRRGETRYGEGLIVIGERAFADESVLVSTLGHELVHMFMWRALGGWAEGSAMDAFSEWVALDWEDQYASKTGLSGDRVKQVQAYKRTAWENFTRLNGGTSGAPEDWSRGSKFFPWEGPLKKIHERPPVDQHPPPGKPPIHEP